MLLEDKVRLKADEYVQAMSVLTFPFVYWQDVDPNIISFASTYCEFLTGLYGSNRFKRLYRNFAQGLKNQEKNSVMFDKGTVSLVKKYSGGGGGKGDDDDKKQKNLSFNAPSIDNVIQPITMKIPSGNEVYLITIQALLTKLKFDFTDTLVRDIKISGSGVVNWITKIAMKNIRRALNTSLNQIIKKYPSVFDKSVGTEVFNRSSFGEAFPDIMKTTYCFVDLSELPPEYENKIFDKDVLVNMISLGWSGFVFYIPEKSRLIFISRRLTYDHIGSGQRVSPDDFDIRFVNLNMLRSFSNLAEKSQYFTKDQLDKIMSNVSTVGFQKGLSIARKLVQK